MSNILTVDQVIENAENPHLEFKQCKFLLNAKISQSEIEKFLEVIGLHPCDLGFPKGKDLWSREKEDKFFSRILTSILPYEGEIEVDYEYLLSVYRDVSLCFESSSSDEDQDEEDEDQDEEDEDQDEEDVYKGYVKTSDGKILLQIPDPQSRWGFYLADEEQSWDGGLGIATSWEVIDPSEVSKEDKERLGWILEQ
jgi:hypothetical protein